MIKYILKFKFAMWSIIKDDNIDCQKNLFVLTLHNIVHTTTSSSSECIIIINHPLSCSKNNIIHNGRILYYTPTYVLFQMWWMDIKR